MNTEVAIQPEYVTQAEYLRRKNKQRQEANSGAAEIAPTTLRRKIKEGHIVIFEEGGNKYIDWNIYGDFLFKKYDR